MDKLFRPVRELLSEAMAECQSWDTLDDLRRLIAPSTLVRAEHQGRDARIGWDSWLLIGIDEEGEEAPCGYTNAPPTPRDSPENIRWK